MKRTLEVGRLLGLVAVAALLPPLPDSEAALAGCEVARRATAYSGASPVEDLVLGVCDGIRPGAYVKVGTPQCSLGFLLKAGAQWYASIAGHCASVGDEVRLRDGTLVGTAVFSRNEGIGEDFAVLRIRPEVEGLVDPAMCGWGGPTGLWSPPGELYLDDRVLRLFGHGMLVEQTRAERARSAPLTYFTPRAFALDGPVSPGDSGAPVRTASGEAVGVFTDGTAVRWEPGGLPTQGTNLPPDKAMWAQVGLGTRLDYGLQLARAATGLPLELATAPLRYEADL